MAKRVIKIGEMSKYLGDEMSKTKKHARKSVIRGVYKTLPNIIRESPVDTGLYAQSWEVKEIEKKIILGNTAPHSPIIEYGARPFKPPIKPLLEWAKRVLRDPSQEPNYSNEVWGLAVGTQKKIEQHGMMPKHILSTVSYTHLTLPTIYSV